MLPSSAPAGAGFRDRAGRRDLKGDTTVLHTLPIWAPQARSVSRCGLDTAHVSHCLLQRPAGTAAEGPLHSPSWVRAAGSEPVVDIREGTLQAVVHC
ncbi:hypothetical protein NDU88_010456 [Pleurodeles waltl]|uniref:Uncharacterized protein n=1 Tax=Pleurodeles waltl TaxID=8319 RepID=A0AAV7RZ31_PLEWA|nr:hypothetical protein NDU88_010456 [Pleurodeles waltl]